MRIITDKNELEKVRNYMGLAAMISEYSKCTKTKRGVVIAKDNKILGIGCIQSTLEELCHPCIRLNKHDAEYQNCPALHAEEMAINSALQQGYKENLEGATLYHLKVKNGKWRESSPGKGCKICSRYIAYYKINVVLSQSNGFVMYDSNEIIKDIFLKSQ